MPACENWAAYELSDAVEKRRQWNNFKVKYKSGLGSVAAECKEF
jgi:hypothetical protein